MNKLSVAKQVQILSMLCEGSSMRSISRVVDVSINTVTKLLVDAGEACLALHDDQVRNVTASRIQCDEIWSFCHAKQKNVATAKAAPEGAGDVWTWTAIDADTKLMVAYFVGDRGAESAMWLMDDLRGRLANRVQLTTDGHKAYLEAVEGAFGGDVEVSPKKTYVSLRRSKQFALVQPTTKTRVDVGLCLKGEATGPRLEAAGSFNSMVSHRVRLEKPADVDAELVGWLRQAYERA